MIEVDGFKISAYMHSASTRKRPIWYGTVDGRVATVPWMSQESAVTHAVNSLKNGSCLSGLLDSMDCYKGWIAQGYKPEDTLKKIADVQARLHKVAAYLSGTNVMDQDSFTKQRVLEVLAGKHDYDGGGA